ncbi:uncharacterized protein LOC106175365 [Lingula anatina]|uniref:Uncharacterized protein LOC106175365 n=1 Tax=Lingula anatina TaxID=7574 RepID=A0A1S3JRP1_LINAN|nr:uncharacterized protein LOC106175365 [Lingula anatina]|eukprot:XP_013412761.1 uncharacterized protein LOC106175365 [Lingula anatina]
MSSVESKRPVRRAIPRLMKIVAEKENACSTAKDGSKNSVENVRQQSATMQKNQGRRSVLPGPVSDRLTRPTMASRLKNVSANFQNESDLKLKENDVNVSSSSDSQVKKRVPSGPKSKPHQTPGVVKRRKPSSSGSSPFQIPDSMPLSKKNPAQESKKCTVQFQPTIDTKFGIKISPPGKKKDFTFTGAAKMTSESKDTKSKPEIKPDIKKSNRTRPWQHSEVTRLKEDLAEIQAKLEEAEKENCTLNNELNERKKKDKEIKDHLNDLTLENSSLKNRISSCEVQLEKCHIDPVTLQPLDLDQEEIKKRSQEAQAKASALRDVLKHNVNNQCYLASLKEINEKCEAYLNSM